MTQLFNFSRTFPWSLNNTDTSRQIKPDYNSTWKIHTDIYTVTSTQGGYNSSNWNITTPTSQLPNQKGDWVTQLVLLWSLPIIITFGTMGNVFSFIVMLRREMRQTSTFFYLATLAVADTIVLFVSAFKTWIRLCTGFEMLHISDISCKLLMFLIYFSLHFSAWLIVAVTVERFIVVWFPLRATSFCSLSRAKIISASIAACLGILNAHLFWTANLVTDPNKRCAMAEGKHALLYNRILPWLHLTLYSFLPFLSLLIFNTLIIWSLIKHRQIIANQMTKDDRRARYTHRRLAITLLCISFVWILTTTPSALYTVLPLKPKTDEERSTLLLVKCICYILLYINHSINFVLYCITGQNFRQELMKFLRQLCRRKKRSARLTFRASQSGSGQGTTFPLMDNKYSNKGSLMCCSNRTTETVVESGSNLGQLPSDRERQSLT